MNLHRFSRDIYNAVRNGKFTRLSDGGLAVFNNSLRVNPMFHEGIRGQPDSWRTHRNLVPDAAILHYLGVTLKGVTQITAWYLAPYGGNATPLANWNAGNFTANATELTSTVEGYTESTRQQWVGGTPAAGSVGNDASKATFTIATATTLNIYGAGLLSSSTRGGTTGVLLSAVKFGTVRVANAGDPWQCQYDVTLAD